MKPERLNELCDAVAGLRNRTEVLAFLKDILTPKELSAVVERLQIIKMLARMVPQREISKKLGISIAKVTRGSRALKTSRGGFRRFIRQGKISG